jgi:hypothetical protein
VTDKHFCRIISTGCIFLMLYFYHMDEIKPMLFFGILAIWVQPKES